MGGSGKLTELQVIFLGTGGSIPTPQRGLSAIAIKRKAELILFDCGEGTQRQMIQAGVGFHRKTKIFITHMHGDHVLGLPGLLQTMSLLDRTKKLGIYGPQGIKAFVEAINQTVRFSLTFPIKVCETDSGQVCEEKEYTIYATRSNHINPSLSFAFVEKQRPGKFYKEKAEELLDNHQKELFLVLAGEERKHFILMDNFVEFISRPDTWLENAEFFQIDEY